MADEKNGLVELLSSAGPAFERMAGASIEVLGEIERSTGRPLPEEYRHFLLWSDGGELDAAPQAIDFWDAATVVLRNDRLGVRTRLPEVLLIGSNEGETAIGLRMVDGEHDVVAVPFGDLSRDGVRSATPTLADLVIGVFCGQIDLDEIGHD